MKFQIFEQHLLSSWMALLRSQSYISHIAKQQYSEYFWCALEMMTHCYLEILNFHICQWCCINNIWVLIATMFCSPSGSDGRVCPQCRRPGFSPWVRKMWRREWQRTPIFFLLGNPIDRGDWWAIVHESDTTVKFKNKIKFEINK